MIHESYFWKKELYNSFLTIAKFRHLKRVNEQSQVNVEKAIMIGAYVIRKLDDAQKIPPDFMLRQEKLNFSESKGTVVDHINWHKIDSHYDLSKSIKVEKDWRFIINQMIHSFSFFFSEDESGRLNGFFFNSDSSKKKGLFFIPLEVILTMFISVSEGDITMSHSNREVLGVGSDGKPKFGGMKLTSALYSYANDFDATLVVKQSMNGEIYKREEF
jgi:hypothetical protein